MCRISWRNRPWPRSWRARPWPRRCWIPLFFTCFTGVDRTMGLPMICRAPRGERSSTPPSAARKLAAATCELKVAGKGGGGRSRAEIGGAAPRPNRPTSQAVLPGEQSQRNRTPLNGVLGMAQAMAAGVSPRKARPPGRDPPVGRGPAGDPQRRADPAKVDAGFERVDRFRPPRWSSWLCAGFTAGVRDGGRHVGGGHRRGAASTCGDPTRLRQILHNLISNARKFTDRGEVIIAALIPGGVAITIADNGIGTKRLYPRGCPPPFRRPIQFHHVRCYMGTGRSIYAAGPADGRRHLRDQRPGAAACASPSSADTRVGDERAALQQAAATPEAECSRVLVAEDNAVNQLVIKTLLGRAGSASRSATAPGARRPGAQAPGTSARWT